MRHKLSKSWWVLHYNNTHYADKKQKYILNAHQKFKLRSVHINIGKMQGSSKASEDHFEGRRKYSKQPSRVEIFSKFAVNFLKSPVIPLIPPLIFQKPPMRRYRGKISAKISIRVG